MIDEYQRAFREGRALMALRENENLDLDMTEFESKTGPRMPREEQLDLEEEKEFSEAFQEFESRKSAEKLPAFKDWRETGCIRDPICSCCYAIAASNRYSTVIEKSGKGMLIAMLVAPMAGQHQRLSTSKKSRRYHQRAVTLTHIV